MMINQDIYSDFALAPSEYLLEIINETAMSQAELARRMGRPVQVISEIVNGLKSITPETALQLEQVVGVPAHIWTGLEAEYQLVKARQMEAQKIEDEVGLASEFPYPAIAKLGWVRETRNKIEKVKELRRFFSVASLHNLPGVKAYAPAFRQVSKDNVSHEALVAWLRGGAMEAEKITTEPFDLVKAKAAVETIRSFTNKDPQHFLPLLKDELAQAGVAFVLLPHLPKTYVHGATFWATPSKAIMLMTIRGSWSDIFWFSLFHELGHILLHDKRHTFLENGAGDPSWKKQESEADEFSQKTLIPLKEYNMFVRGGLFSYQSIAVFSETINIAPGIVSGRLQHDGLLPPNHHHHRIRYKWGS